jgi:NAD(P)H-nitrite reductase large subunit
MPKIVIIGNSAAGFSACQALIRRPDACPITVISQEEYPAYQGDLLVDFLDGTVKESDLFLCDDDFYQKNSVNFLKNAHAARVDAKKRRVILKDNTKLEYDFLIIASGTKIDIPDIPGKTKEGVVPFYTLGEAKRIKEKLMVARDVCIIGPAAEALKSAAVIAAKGKDVKIICPEAHDAASPHEKIEIISGRTPQELIGEGAQLQALKLSSGKVLSADLVIFLSERTAATGFLKETDIKTHQGYIVVDANMHSSIDTIVACGAVCRLEGQAAGDKSWDQAAREGTIAAQTITETLETFLQRGAIDLEERPHN